MRGAAPPATLRRQVQEPTAKPCRAPVGACLLANRCAIKPRPMGGVAQPEQNRDSDKSETQTPWPAGCLGKLTGHGQGGRRVPRGRGVSAGVSYWQVPEARRQPGEPVGAGPVGLAVGDPVSRRRSAGRPATFTQAGALFAPFGGLFSSLREAKKAK
jgi:hypothetical protein